MPTTIDTLQIEIQSSSGSAVSGIRDLAGALTELKRSGTVTTVIKNLNSLSASIKGFSNASGAASALNTLATAIERLKSVGSIASIGNTLAKLPASLKSLENINIDGVAPKLRAVADAVAPLSAVKAGGLNTMMNALSKLGSVTKSLDDEKIAAFAEKIEKLNTVLEPLSMKMTTIKTGFNAISTNARKATSAVKDLGEGVNASALNLSSFISIAQTVAGVLSNVVQQFSAFIGEAIEWDGVAARFGRGFGDQAAETYAWIQRLNEEMGINVQQFMQYSSIYATMLTGFGVANEDATKMALGYTELTYDIWAGYNDVYASFAEASEAVKSAIAGEVEPIRRAGFTIIESTLEQTAANHGLEISLANATEAQKSYLRYLTLVDQAHAQNLVGTYAKELNTAEGLMRTFSQQLKSLVQTFGSLFLPILVKVMPYLQAFVEILTDGIRAIAAFFGITIQGVDWSGYNAGVGEATENTDGLTGSLGDAAAAAKELKNATLGIDELNVISPPSASTGSGGAGGGGGAGDGFSGLDIDSLWDESIFDNIQSQVDDIKQKFEDWLPVIGAIGTALGALGITTLLKNVGEAISQMGLLQKIFASVAIVAIEAALVFSFADNYLESGNLINLVGEALVTAASGYLLFKAWGPTGALLGLSVSILAQLVAMEMSLADGTVELSSPELWVQAITTALMGAIGGALITKHTGFFAKEGFMIGLAISASLVLTSIRMGAIESGEISSDSVEAWITEVASIASAGLAGKYLGTALYKGGGPMGALIGVTAGLVLNLVGTITVKGEDFGNEISDWINAALTSATALFTGAKLWGLIGPTIKTTLASIIPNIGTALSSALSGLGAALAAIPGWGWAIAAVVALLGGGIALAVADFDFTDVGHKLGEGIGKAVRGAVNLWESFTSWISDAWDKTVAWCAENLTTEGLIKNLTNLVNWYDNFIDSGREVVNGIIAGIKSGWENFKSNISEFIDGVIQGFKDGFGIASPAKTMIPIGEYLVEGIWEGILGLWDWITGKFKSWGADLVAVITGEIGLDDIKEKLKSAWSTAKDWWNKGKDALNSYTPAIGSIKDKLSSAWSTAKTWWSKSKSALSTYTPSIGSIYEKLKDRWDSARTWWNSKKTKAKEYTPSIGSIYEKLKVRWDNARDWWNKQKKGVNTYTPSIGSITDKLKSAWNSAKSWWNKNVKLSTKLDIKVPTIKVKWETATAFGKSFKYPKGFDLKFAAAGGIFDAGSLIWAGERGAEVVANASGGKTGVMNVQQMQDAVYEGVFSAVSAAMRGTGGGEQNINVYLDGRQITATVERRQRERGATIMGNEVYSY